MQVKETVGEYIKQISDALEKRANNELRPEGLTMVQLWVLLLLRDYGPEGLTLKELERMLHVAQSTTAGIVSRLESKKLIESFGNPRDRRIKSVRLTDSGYEKCQRADLQMREAERHLTDGFTPEEKETFLRLLKKSRDNLV